LEIVGSLERAWCWRDAGVPIGGASDVNVVVSVVGDRAETEPSYGHKELRAGAIEFDDEAGVRVGIARNSTWRRWERWRSEID
jgi:hypothetical protein